MALRVLSLLVLAGCQDRVQGPHGIVGGRELDGYFYVVPAVGGVVLVDTGEDPQARLLRELVAGRPVLGVLVTHAHHDHYAAAAGLGVPVWFGRGEGPFLRGETAHRGEAQRAVQAARGGADLRPPVPGDLRSVDDGDLIAFGSESFRALHLPGHTPGSTAYLYREVLFGGDAVMGFTDRLEPIEARFSDDPGVALRSLERLKTVTFNVVLDGHRGASLLGPSALP